ncbi:MAG: hypothetical protein V7K97_12970 [Nostoc sp.]|uniref:hypothetical protein n=1 Tax=Nostoc sp. TaxID=1180 RepID=UPI002FF6C9C6
MSIWIVTTGNSDIILKHDKTWGRLYEEASDHLECSDFGSASRVNPDDKEAGYTVPSRILGIVYAKQLQECYEDDLRFPLLDTYCKYFTDKNIKIEKIILLLTDQSKIFSSEEQRLHQKSPYWKDTCTLEPLFKWYFQHQKFTCKPEFQYLIPDQKSPGIDNWDATLSLVETKLQELEIDARQEVYVSHQAGTPAISSAVQFVTLGKFKKVQFLVSNEYFDEEYYQLKSKYDSIQSSRYQRGMQIQKAKQLIIKGLPAAAKEVLTGIANQETIEKINQIVDLFNIKSFLVSGQEFEVKASIDRIVTALDLVEIFFKQENYIQGVAILNATQETFLKAAIISQTKKINEHPIPLSNIVGWDKYGLFIKSQNTIKNLLNLQNPLEILKQLNFPNPIPGDFNYRFWEEYQNDKSKKLKLNNSTQFQWLCELRQDFKAWGLLEWSCRYKREEDDLRNQLLHNLLGVNQQEVRDYLLGYNQDSIKRFLGNFDKLKNDSEQITNEAYQAYYQDVKLPFLKALKLFGLWRQEVNQNKLEIKLQEIADSLI